MNAPGGAPWLEQTSTKLVHYIDCRLTVCVCVLYVVLEMRHYSLD